MTQKATVINFFFFTPIFSTQIKWKNLAYLYKHKEMNILPKKNKSSNSKIQPFGPFYIKNSNSYIITPFGPFGSLFSCSGFPIKKTVSKIKIEQFTYDNNTDNER